MADAKMHELLAVESSITANYNRDSEETKKVFERGDLFRREVTAKEYFDAADAEKLNTIETKEITTTVDKRLEWHSKSIASLFDIVYQKDKTNQTAVADIEVGGSILAASVPATTLLMLESKLQDIRKVFETIPVLAPGIKWEEDKATGYWVTADPTQTFSTKKVTKPVVMYEATKEHPAQVKEVSEDVVVAKITKTVYAGLWTSGQKADLLGRVDQLLAAVKQARMRANMVKASKETIGSTLVKFLIG